MDWPVIASSAITGVVGIGGVLLGGHLARRTEQRRVANEDARRWLADRRHFYAAYLAIVASMLRSIYDKVSIFGKEGIAPDDESMLKEFLIAFYRRWNDEVQPAVGEVQLLASPAVTDLADRTSWALMELHQIVDEGRARDSVRTGELLAEFSVKSYHLLDATRNAMRTELGLTTPIKAAFSWYRDGPWLPDGPEDHGED